MWRRAIHFVGVGTLSALVCALASSTWEVADLALSDGPAASNAALAGGWFVSFSLSFVVLSVWSAVLLLPVLGISAGRPGEASDRLLRRMRGAFRIREDDPLRIAAALATFIAVALFAAATYVSSRFCITSFNKPELVAAAITCFSLASGASAWLARGGVKTLLVQLGRWPWLRPPWYSFPVVVGAALACVVVGAVLLVVQWSTWLPGVGAFHLVQIGTAFLLHFVVGLLLLGRYREFGKKEAPRMTATFWYGATSAILLPLVAALCLYLTLGSVGSRADVRRFYLSLAGQTSVWSDLARSATDFDGDGYTHFMGGGDCDPHNADVAPGKADIADNGVDEDCFEGDFRTGLFLASHSPDWYLGADLAIRPYDVVIIGGDGLNFSRTTMGGNTRNTTPFLDRWSREHAVVFEKAYCAVPYTGFSHLAMFTGMLPLSIKSLGEGVADKVELPDHLTSLPRYFKGRGYSTFGVDTTVKKWAPWVDKGFDRFKYLGNGKAADVAAQIIRAFARSEKGSPFFLWAFFYDAHHPYLIEGMEELESFGDTPVDEYDLRLLFWDRQLEAMFTELGDRLDNAVVIFYSDHGEEVNSEEWLGHGKKIIESHVKVPLIISVPGIPPARLSAPVSLIDLFPTLVNLVEGAALPNRFEGKSLVGRMVTGVEPEGRLVFTETYRGDVRYAVTDGRFKLLYNLTDNQTSFFDLQQDPYERRRAGDKYEQDETRLERAVRHYVTGSRGYWRNRALATVQREEAPPGMTEPLAQFDDVISLLGARVIKEGKRVFLEVYYRCEKQMDKDYRATTHVIKKATKKFINQDHVPVSPVLGTSQWNPGKVYTDRFELPSNCRKVDESDIWVGFHKGKEVLVPASQTLPLREKKVLLNAAIDASDATVQPQE